MCTWGLNEWGDIANIVIAVASVATAIVTAVVLFKQRNDNIKEKQPRFTFTQQNESLIIRGEQSTCLQIEGMDINRCVEAWRLDKKLRKVIPLKHSPVVRITQDDTGIYASFSLYTMQNAILLNQFKCDEMEIDSRLWNYRVVDLLCIKYIDIHLCHREQYFVNRTIASKKEYKKYLKLARKVGKVPLLVSDIDLRTILEID